jgi:hypothetical protein
MSKVTTEHFARSACVYIRQSTADLLMHNHEPTPAMTLPIAHVGLAGLQIPMEAVQAF